MFALFIIFVFIFPIQIIGASPEIIVEKPFYLRARILDFQTVNVLFEIAEENNQRTCQMYKFTIRRNQEKSYSMPEQNLTCWSNSLELKHLPSGDYRVCASICSERLRQRKYHYMKKNRTIPIIACVNFHAYRPHLLVLTLYFLVFILLTISHIIFSLRKRQFQARIKAALAELENSVQKWRSTQTSTDHIGSYSILQSLVTFPVLPIEHSVTSQISSTTDDQHPIVFHLEIPNEQQ